MNPETLSEGTITRFAPSLTGYLHLGHVFHMIYVWGVAQTHNARVISRMEDHDQGRNRPEYEPAILADMEWLGFVPDEGMTVKSNRENSTFRQSDCSAAYEQILTILQQDDRVYGCACSRKDILASQPAEVDELCYSGTCAEKRLPLEGHTVRFRVPENEVLFQDLALGECRHTPKKQCGDFSLRDRDGQWTYQFCCVVDDIRQGVNLVVRGADIMPSTGRQIQLFHALQQRPPAYFHHPLLLDETGRKLSKRQHCKSIRELRESGITAEEVLGRAAFSGGLIPGECPLTMTDIKGLFD